jgi:hypothetical protein
MPQSHSDWPKTLDEFRAWHERQPEVWEFIDGVPKLMAPDSMAHTLIKSNAGRLLGNALDQTGCRALVDGRDRRGRGLVLDPGRGSRTWSSPAARSTSRRRGSWIRSPKSPRRTHWYQNR